MCFILIHVHTKLATKLEKSIVDTLYSGHLALADTYFRSQGSIFFQNHLYISDSLYSGHLEKVMKIEIGGFLGTVLT